MADVDVVVAGAGGAGLAAALAAAEAGRSVLLLEARQSFRAGCNTARSTAMIPAGGSRWQQAAGIDDSPELFLHDVQHKTNGCADPVVAQALTGVAPSLVEWLADHWGIALELVTDFSYPGHSQYRCHTVANRSGKTLHQALLAAARAQPLIDLLVPRRLTDVQVGDDGAVTGVRIETPDRHGEQLTCRSVVLATNGFAADADLVARHLPEMTDALYFGGDGSTGDALRIGDELGADLACLDAYQGHGSVATPQGVLLTWATVMHGAILVNAAGERFGNESAGYSEFATPVLRQPGASAWAILDGRVDALCRSFADYQDCLQTGAVRRAADLGELARLTGAPEAALADTLAVAAACARGHGADEFGRRHWGEEPLAPPYAAVKVTGALFHTQGGLRVDPTAAVLRGGEPVPGLYAAGGAATGMSGTGAAGYLAGNGLLAALGLGYLAGRSAGRSNSTASATR